MERDTLRKIRLGAAILLAPDGFILAATLIANRARKRRAAADAELAAVETDPEISA